MSGKRKNYSQGQRYIPNHRIQHKSSRSVQIPSIQHFTIASIFPRNFNNLGPSIHPVNIVAQPIQCQTFYLTQGGMQGLNNSQMCESKPQNQQLLKLQLDWWVFPYLVIKSCDVSRLELITRAVVPRGAGGGGCMPPVFPPEKYNYGIKQSFFCDHMLHGDVLLPRVFQGLLLYPPDNSR